MSDGFWLIAVTPAVLPAGFFSGFMSLIEICVSRDIFMSGYMLDLSCEVPIPLWGWYYAWIMVLQLSISWECTSSSWDERDAARQASSMSFHLRTDISVMKAKDSLHFVVTLMLIDLLERLWQWWVDPLIHCQCLVISLNLPTFLYYLLGNNNPYSLMMVFEICT